jgi:DNA polymerase III epsilon subunit-like protein
MPPKNISNPSFTIYPCVKCEKSFSSAHALADHGRSTGHSMTCAASGCTETFTSQEALIQHVTSSVHKNTRSNRLQNPAQQTRMSPVWRDPKRPNQTIKFASNSISARNKIPSQSGNLGISNETVKAPAHIPAGSISNDIYKEPLKATRVSAAYIVPLVQKTAHVFNKSKQPLPSGLNTELQGELRSPALPPNDMLQPVRNASLYGFYMPYDFNDCYLVATPRNGGIPLISPLITDYGGNDLEFALLLPTSHQQTRSTSLAKSGSCKFCGFVFTSWEPLKSHFKSSSCSSSRTRLPTEGSVNPSQPLHKQGISNGSSTTSTTKPVPQSGTNSNAQVLSPQPKGRWSVIPKPQRKATLAALASFCHTYATLLQNKYASGPGYSYTMGVEVELSLIPLPTPVHKPEVLRRGAVALDCEMVGVTKGKSEVARISAIDCLTGEVLIDTMVQPTQPITDCRTKFSGITKKAMTAAVAEKRALKGWPAARAELWKYIDSDTILIGQALHHDLDALRMQHWQVVDSAILARDAVGAGVSRQWGLKTLCDQLLGIDIQNAGNKGHDSVEDAFAAREVVLWCIGHQDELAVWGKRQKEEYFRKKQAQEIKKGKTSQQRSSSDVSTRYYTHDRDEIVRWEDIAEDCGWPHPDTGYDPWSD